MCGLFGYLAKSSTSKKADTAMPRKAVELAVYLTQLRGVHSLGMAYAHFDTKDNILRIGHIKESESDSGVTRLVHSTETPHEKLTKGRTFDQVLNTKDLRMLAVHTRHATRGAKNKENSHPFREGNILLMHNGTLRNDYQINQKYFDVDSKALAYHLDQQGNSVQTLVEKTNGAYALVWQDYRDSTLNLLRNSERPLFLAESEDFFVWASTLSVLGALSFEHGIQYTAIQEVPEHTHLQFNIKSGTLLGAKKYEAPKFPVAAVGFYGRGGLYADDYDIYGTASTTGAGSTTGNFQQPVNRNASSGGKGNSQSTGTTASTGSSEWWDHLLSLVGSSKTCSIYQMDRSPLLPSAFRRTVMGMEELRRLDKLPSPMIFRGNMAANAANRHLVSVHGGKVTLMYKQGGISFVRVENCRYPNKEMESFELTVTMPESEYRTAMYFGMLVLATPMATGIVHEVATGKWKRGYSVGQAARYFDPTIQGLCYLEKDKQEELEESELDLLMKEMGSC